jgi:hypothetical protein
LGIGESERRVDIGLPILGVCRGRAITALTPVRKSSQNKVSELSLQNDELRIGELVIGAHHSKAAVVEDAGLGRLANIGTFGLSEST